MDPFGFDMEAYFKKRDVEDSYMVNRFIQRRKKLEEGSASRTRKYFNRDHAAANQRLIDDYFANDPTYDDAMFRRRYRINRTTMQSLETFQVVITTSPNELMQPIKKVYHR